MRIALSAIDMAFEMRTRGRSGSRFLIFLAVMHGHCPPMTRRGLGLMVPRALVDEAEKMLTLGLKAWKLRLGYPTLAEDLAAYRLWSITTRH
jgi:mandelate racemase